jgi:hypothetical protein
MSDITEKSYWEQFFQSLQMTYYGLLAGPLFIFAIAFLRSENGNDPILFLSDKIELMLVVFVLVLAVIGMVIIHFYTKSIYTTAMKLDDLKVKLATYKRATLNKYIVLSILQVIAVAAFAITYHNGLMGIFTALLLFASFFRPELQNAKRDLRLSKAEYALIDYKSN